MGCLTGCLWPTLAILQRRPVARRNEWSLWCHDRGYTPRQVARDFLRVLPAEDRGDGEELVGDHQAAGAAVAELRLGDLWRRRLDPRAHPFHHHPDFGRD